MKIFKWKIITNDEYVYLRHCEIKYQKLLLVRDWFSGWEDLRIIFRYILRNTNYGGIESARKEYAEARGTDEYGRKINESKKSSNDCGSP